MWWILVIVIIIGWFIYQIKIDYDEFGGIEKEYSILISYFKSCGFQTQKKKKTSIQLFYYSSYWHLDYFGNNLQVRMSGYIPLLGVVSKKWNFPIGYSQEKMIEDIEEYQKNQIKKGKELADNNQSEHIVGVPKMDMNSKVILNDPPKKPLKWSIKNERLFTQEEVEAVEKTVVVASKYGNSVCFFMKGGGQTFIPLSRDSIVIVGSAIDLSKASILTLEGDGESDIIRIKI